MTSHHQNVLAWMRYVALDPADVIAWARDTMANYKVPRHVALSEALPVNASMKVLKHELRALLPA